MSEDKKILIVDDDLTLREMYEERLKYDGFVVIGASDGEEAVQKIKQEMPDLILLDVMMPKMNGIDVLRAIRCDDNTKHIPVIILTALIQEIDKLKSLMNEKDGYLIKSEQMPKEVLAKVHEILGWENKNHSVN